MNNFLNLPEINQEEALNLTKFFIKSDQNIFLMGRRGAGKSEIALQAAKECGKKVHYINLSVIERSDLVGFPNMFAEGDIVHFKSPYFLPPLQLDQQPDSVILFDEIDKAAPETTAPLLEILLFRKVNGKPINASSCILTGNLMNEGTFSNQISTALLDRGAKYVLTFDFEKWIGWCQENNIHDLILGFLRSDPSWACGKIDDTSYASPSPRSWTLASHALYKSKELKMNDIETVSKIISGYVGNEAGLRFKLWYEHFRKFEPFVHSLIEKDNLSLNYSALIPTEKFVFVVAACFLAKQKVVKDKKNKCLYLDRLCKFFKEQQVDVEMQLVGLNNSFPFSFITQHKLYQCQQFFDVCSQINGIAKSK